MPIKRATSTFDFMIAVGLRVRPPFSSAIEYFCLACMREWPLAA